MQVLLDALSKWPGRSEMEARLEERDLRLHLEYRILLLQNCEACDVALLKTYWDEEAHECVASAGRVDSPRRDFSRGGLYRSAYLDELHSDPENAAAGSQGRPLDKGLREFFDKSISVTKPSQTLSGRLVEITESLKSKEIDALGIESPLDWNGGNSFETVLESIARSAGFQLSQKWWRKPINDALERRCRIDTGRRSSSKYSTPLEYEIGYRKGETFSYDLSATHRVVPGFQHYRFYATAQSAVLGVIAQVNYLDIMGELLASPA